MRGLFVAEKMFVRDSGSKVMEESYYKCLMEVTGRDNLDVIAIKNMDQDGEEGFICLNRTPDYISFLFGYSKYLNRKLVLNILKIIKDGKYDFVFFMNQAFGKFIKLIKRKYPQILIATYYPGVHAYHQKTISYYHPPLKERLVNYNSIYNERLCTRYSDVRILLNARDDENLYRYYKIHATDLIPIFIDDCLKLESSDNSEKVMDDRHFNMLFVGVYFPPNVHGLKWFIGEVLSKLDDDIHLTIVGSGMEQLKNEVASSSKLSIIGRVESLTPYYTEADVVIEPIFKGDGMKTKTAEALMYGKMILGTDEALCGYVEGTGMVCNTVDEYLSTIERLRKNGIKKYLEEKRKIYLTEYSVESAVLRLRSILKRFNII